MPLKLTSNYLRQCAQMMSTKTSQRTVLFDLHKSLGGRIVDFAGFEMPVDYKGHSIGESAKHTRSACSIFDVSHMLQTNIIGKDRIEYIESMTTGDIQGLKDGSGTLTVFTNSNGGIEDDLIVTKTNDNKLQVACISRRLQYSRYVVTNAGCIAGDTKIMAGKLDEFKSQGKDVHVEHVFGRGLLAVQGPTAVKIVEAGLKHNLTSLLFMNSITATLYGIEDCRITRCGYTGEDGFEISVPENRAVELCERLLKCNGVKMAGLGARDLLRLEAGLCLYGNDMDSTTTPVEATLMWLIAKRRRAEANFPGASTILAQIADKSLLTRKRVGFTSTKGRPPRHGMPVVDLKTGDDVGIVTSGCPSACIEGHNIGMAYVQPKYMKAGTQLGAVVGKGKTVDIQVAKMPFIPSNYYTGK